MAVRIGTLGSASRVNSVKVVEEPWFVLPFSREMELPFVFAIPAIIAMAVLHYAGATSGFIHQFEFGLDLSGIVNAGFLTLVSIYGEKVMPAVYRPVLREVNASGYHKLWGIPNAWLGEGTYLAMAAATFIAMHSAQYHEKASFVVAVLSVIGVAFSARLMRAMYLKIRRVCPFCVLSAGTMTVVSILSVAHWVATGAKFPF